jgi:hypothetical protein
MTDNNGERVMISRLLVLMVASALATAGGIAVAQTASEAAKTPATSSSTAASSSDSADAEAAATAALIAKANAAAAAAAAAKSSAKIMDEATFAKTAKKAGWHTEVQNGTTYYCKQLTDNGTHFSTKHCATSTQLAVVLEQQQYEKDQLGLHGCGGNCTGKEGSFPDPQRC